MSLNGRELWDLIQEKARNQEDVDDNWQLTMVDLGKPMYTGRAEYRLMNIVSRNVKNGVLYQCNEQLNK